MGEGVADGADGAAAVGGDSPPGVPRWVKLFGVVAALVLALVLVLLLTGGNHGPGRHSDRGEPPAPGMEHSVPRR